MSGLIGAMNTALSGLKAFETGIGIVSQNLTNQTTVGYGNETANLATAAGSGVQAPIITRAADGFSAGLLRAATSAGQAASTQSTVLTNISNALQNNGNIQSSLSQFFLGVGTLAATPTSHAAQQVVLGDAQTVAGTFQNAASALTDSINGSTLSLQQGVGQANNLLTQLAGINTALAGNPNSPSLLDQQEAALKTLSGILPVNVLPQANGQILISTGGTVLLDQSGAQPLSVAAGALSTAPVVTAGANPAPLTLGGSAGTLGASIQTWNAGTQATQSLNALASIVSATVNTAQAEGLTPTGLQGQALFAVPTPSVKAASSNTGSATLTAQLTNAGQLPVDGGPFQLTLTGSAPPWSAISQATGANYPVTTGTTGGPPPATTLAFAGITAIINSGAAATGDQFTVNPALGAAAGISVVATNPNQIASADPYVATPGTWQTDGSIQNNNAGTTIFGADTVTSSPTSGAAVVPESYYGQTLQVTFTSASAYNVSTAASPAVTISSGTLSAGAGNIAVAYPAGAAAGEYWQLPISGTPAAGDAVTISPGGSSSGSNASRLAALWTQPLSASQGSLQQSVVGLATSLGANAQQAQLRATATASQVTTATGNLATIASVSSDQQAVILTGYSQAYQAAAQVISTAHSMFESLLQSV